MQATKTLNQSQLSLLVGALFESGQPVVFESYSAYDTHLKSFASATDLAAYIDRKLKQQGGVALLAVQYPEALGQVQTATINLRPETCAGATWRETVEGWGLIQVQLKGNGDGTSQCRIAVNSEARANAWSQTYPQFGPPSRWNWKVVERHARRLVRVLRSAT
jgi:hypothetical protein